jgi:hypothetical protein
MQIVDLNNPGEKKKLIWAALLGLVAILFLWWTLIGFGSSSKTTQTPVAVPKTTRNNQTVRTQPGDPAQAPAVLEEIRLIRIPSPVSGVPEPKRNIFAYYEPPPPTQKMVVPPTPTPTPTPPVLLAAVSPANVFARTGDFALEVSGDKFSPDLRIYLDQRELGTKYRSPQQLSATVPAAMIANAGTRQILVRSVDGRIYSNAATLSVAQPPTPNYSYVGIIGKPSHVDTALLQDRSNKEILSVQRGDVLSGRFRVTSISDKELVLIDTNLKIKHSLTMIEGEKGAGPLSRPTPNVAAEDDEP